MLWMQYICNRLVKVNEEMLKKDGNLKTVTVKAYKDKLLPLLFSDFHPFLTFLDSL
jgi:PDZ domain-containing secreted protein